MPARLTFEEVKEVFEENGSVLISDTYKNSKEKLVFICKCGEEDSITVKEFKKHPHCSKCSPNRKYTYQQVYDYFNDHGCILRSKEYLNNRQILDYICVCGNISKTKFDRFKEGKRCRKCGSKKSAEKQRYSYSEVHSIFKENGCTLLNKEYTNTKQQLYYICECGNESSIRLTSFLNGTRCNDCGIRKNTEARKHNYEYVKNIFESRDCILISKEYNNNHTKLHYKCSCGEENFITLSDFLGGHDCRKCGNNKISIFNKTKRIFNRGENHPAWDHSIPSEERIKNRWLSEQKIWRKEVYNRDSYTCQCCGDNKGGNLIAHHLDGYDWCKESRWNISNGATLCKICHSDFHHIFGYG